MCVITLGGWRNLSQESFFVFYRSAVPPCVFLSLLFGG